MVVLAKQQEEIVTEENEDKSLHDPKWLVVRDAIPDDMQVILYGAEVFWKESVYSHMDFDREKMAARVIDFMADEQKKLFVIAQEGSPVGVLFASVGPTFLGNDLVAYEETCYILPEARSRGGFDKLLDAFEAWALEEGAKALVFDITSRIRTRRTEEKLEARGYDYAGATLVKRI